MSQAKKLIACAVECGCVEPDTVIFIEGIPHAQMIRIDDRNNDSSRFDRTGH